MGVTGTNVSRSPTHTLSSPQAEAVVVREVLHLAKVAFASGYTTQTPGIGKPQGGGGEGALPQSRS